MQNRVREIDYLKCVFIVLMVVFHLVYVGDKFPYAKQVVYTFHMPAFLLISGYLANMDKGLGKLARQVKWLFVPYAVMETGYVVMGSVLPIREHIEQLTPAVFLDKLLLHPLGPYWYLHTLMVCYVIYYCASRMRPRLGTAGAVCLMGVAMWAAADLLHVVSMSNAIYFMAGAVIRQCGTLQGAAMTWLAVSLALAVYPYLGNKVKTATHFIGANTLAILLFSPIFTIITKTFVPFFAFDPTAMSYTLVSVAFVLAGSLGIAFVMDRLKLSRWFSGKPLYNGLQHL